MADMRITPITKSPTRLTADGTGFYPLRGTRTGEGFFADYLYSLGMQGRIIVGGLNTAASDVVLAQTSFVATTPTFSLEVPSGTCAIPLGIKLSQTTPVAGGGITVIMEIVNAVTRSSSGTALAAHSTRTDRIYTPLCTLYSNPTVAANTVGDRVDAMQMTPNVGATATVTCEPFRWSLDMRNPIFLVGVASMKIYSWAASTAPTWTASFLWAEIPSTDIA